MSGHRHRLTATVAGVALLCLLQGSGVQSMPNPDFGINANINTARSGVVDQSVRLLNEMSTITAVSVTLTGGYTLLADVQTAIMSIGDRFQEAGVAIAQELGSLATDNGPDNVDDAFDAVYTAVESLKTVMTDVVDTELPDLAILTGSFLTAKITDAFGAMSTALQVLLGKLHALQDAVAAARAAFSGAGSVPGSIIRTRVPPRVQTEVVNAIVEVRTRIGAVRFMVHNTLHELEMADEFLVDVTLEAQLMVGAMEEVLASPFTEAVAELIAELIGELTLSTTCLVASLLDDLLALITTLSNIPTFESDLAGSVEMILDLFSEESFTQYSETFSSSVEDYVSAAVALQDDLESVYQSTTCMAVRNTMLVLVAAGPYNRYCFAKYSPRVYSLYELHLYSASRCYENEFYRLVTLAESLYILSDLIVYDIEDIVRNLGVCAELVTNADVCVTTLGGYYGTLTQQTMDKVSLWLELTQHELAASLSRLGACVKSNQYSTLYSVTRMLHNLHNCSENGPQPDGSDD